MSRVSVNKDLIDDLADSIRDKFDEDSQLSLAGMKDVVDDISKRSSTDLTASGATVTAPAGYYASNATKTIPSGSATPGGNISVGGATVSTGTGIITLSKTVSDVPSISAGYISTGTAGNRNISLSADMSIRSSSDLTASGATVTAPAGYYASSASKSVATGTAGTPTATKGTISNHQVSITPSVTNTTGYITGSTINGTAVTVTASELASGSKSISANGTGIDVVGYSTVDVAVPSSGGTIFPLFFTFSADKTRVNFTTSYADAKEAGQINARFVYINDEDEASGRYTGIHSSGWYFEGTTFSEGISFDLQDWDNGLYSVAWGYVNGTLTTRTRHTFPTGTVSITSAGEWNVTGASTAYVQAGSDGTPSAIKGSVSNHSISVTPSVTNTTGWIPGSTKNGVPVTVTASELVSGSQTITQNGTVDVTNLASVLVNVAGSGGLEYETGTWTPASDTSAGVVSFSDSHSTPPFCFYVIDINGHPGVANANIGYEFYSPYYLFGVPIIGSASTSYYGYTKNNYTNSATNSASTTGSVTSSSNLGNNVNTTHIYFSTTSTRQWLASRSYKWIAIWSP